jgi:hypothetical protein
MNLVQCYQPSSILFTNATYNLQNTSNKPRKNEFSSMLPTFIHFIHKFITQPVMYFLHEILPTVLNA